MPNDNAVAVIPRAGLVQKFAGRFNVEPTKLLTTLKQTAFRQKDGEVSNEQMMALLVVADQYNLNPFTKELFAFPDKGGIVPVVSVDGWARIMNDHPAFDGMDFEYGPEENGKPEWIECTIYRKDRAHAIKVRERFKETCRPNAIPWQTHPARMLRHKAMIQCARIAFGFSGIYDEDEARRIIDITANGDYAPPEGATKTEVITAALKAKRPPLTVAAAEPAPNEPNVDKDTGEITGQAESVSFAYVASMLQSAKTEDDRAIASDLIRSVPDERQRAELEILNLERKRLIGGGASA